MTRATPQRVLGVFCYLPETAALTGSRRIVDERYQEKCNAYEHEEWGIDRYRKLILGPTYVYQ